MHAYWKKKVHAYWKLWQSRKKPREESLHYLCSHPAFSSTFFVLMLLLVTMDLLVLWHWAEMGACPDWGHSAVVYGQPDGVPVGGWRDGEEVWGSLTCLQPPVRRVCASSFKGKEWSPQVVRDSPSPFLPRAPHASQCTHHMLGSVWGKFWSDAC